MGQVKKYGMMEVFMKENIGKVRNTEKEHMSGPMEADT